MKTRSNICFITGAPQFGKTTFLLNILATAKAYNLKLGGFVAHGLWQNGQRQGFELERLADGLRVPLSGRNPNNLAERGGYEFYAAGFNAGLAALSPAGIKGKDLVTVDEVGWLELRGEGFAPALPALLKSRVKQIWVVRQDSITKVCQKWGFEPLLIVSPEFVLAEDKILTWLGLGN